MHLTIVSLCYGPVMGWDQTGYTYSAFLEGGSQFSGQRFVPLGSTGDGERECFVIICVYMYLYICTYMSIHLCNCVYIMWIL